MIISFLLTSLAAQGQTTIEFKLTGEVHSKHGTKPLDVTAINQQLKKKKLPQFPEVLVFGKNTAKRWQQLMSGLKKTNTALKTDIELIAEQGYFYEFPQICYRGKASEVPEVVEALMGSVFHPDQGISAIRFGTIKIIHEPVSFFEGNAKNMKLLKVSHAAEIKQWFNFSPRTEKVLVMSDFGPQGDGSELTATSISRCK